MRKPKRKSWDGMELSWWDRFGIYFGSMALILVASLLGIVLHLVFPAISVDLAAGITLLLVAVGCVLVIKFGGLIKPAEPIEIKFRPRDERYNAQVDEGVNRLNDEHPHEPQSPA